MSELRRLATEQLTPHVTAAEVVAQRLAEVAEQSGGRIDVLINNAGLLNAGRFEEIPRKVHHREIDVNVQGVVNGLHAEFPYLKDRPGAVVVNLASASAIYGQAELADYSATKFFVRVIDMWPLYVNTAMTKGVKTGTTGDRRAVLPRVAHPTREQGPGRALAPARALRLRRQR